MTAPPKRKARPKTPKVSEKQVQDAIRNRLFLCGVLCQINPNEARSAAFRRALKIGGTVSGFPDLTVMSSDGRVGFLEVKTPNAKPRNEKDRLHWQRQADIQNVLRRMKQNVAVVRSQDEAVETLQAWGWPVK